MSADSVMRTRPWILEVAGFTAWFMRELVRANAEVVLDVVTPGSAVVSGVVGLPLRTRTQRQRAWLVALVSLTPGTLALGAAQGEGATDGAGVLYVHGMYSPDREEFRSELEELQVRMLRAWPGKEARRG